MLVVLAADDNYALPCGVCITSILTNNPSEDIRIAVLTKALNEGNERRLKQTSVRFNRTIEIKKIDDSLFRNLQVSERFPQSIYFRFLIPLLFPEERVALYLDCDIIVNGSLSPLFNLDINHVACACIEDQCGDDIRIKNSVPEVEIYFNSGVMLMNLEYWRKHDIHSKCIDYIASHENIVYPDQEALNSVLMNQVKFLGYEWNFQELLYLPENQLYLTRAKWPLVAQAKRNPPIIHFTRHLKPWYNECEHPRKDIFIKFLLSSEWKDIPLKNYYPSIYIRAINLLLGKFRLK
jgi:lipopolysaccharide 1,2-glucosyltransferase/general stress protein